MIVEGEEHIYYSDVPFGYLAYLHLYLNDENVNYRYIGYYYTDEQQKLIFIEFDTPEECFAFYMKYGSFELSRNTVAWRSEHQRKKLPWQ